MILKLKDTSFMTVTRFIEIFLEGFIRLDYNKKQNSFIYIY